MIGCAAGTVERMLLVAVGIAEAAWREIAVLVFVEELHRRPRPEVEFNLAGRDPDCFQESLVVLCEHLTSIVQHKSPMET